MKNKIKTKWFVVEQIDMGDNQIVIINTFFETRFKWLADKICSRYIKFQGDSSSEIVVIEGTR